MFDPDLRIQEVVRQIFCRFRDLGSARQVLLAMSGDGIHFPRPSDGLRLTSFKWRPIRYRNVISVLKNMFYAGVYAYGKTGRQAKIRDGRAHVTHKNRKSPEDWDVVIRDHHVGYIDWEEYERNQAQLAKNTFGRAGGVKPGRGGGALLAGLLCCARCGRRLHVVYTGRTPRPVYHCDNPNLFLGQKRCITFGGFRPDKLITDAVLEAVAPFAIDAAIEARAMLSQAVEDKRLVLKMELQQARYGASLAERRYAACDPDNRLIAAGPEKRWEGALGRVRSFGQRLDTEIAAAPDVDVTHLEALEIIREMAGRWSDESIAACRNRMDMAPGQGKTWNAKRVSSIRSVNDIHGYLSANKDGPRRTELEDQLLMFPSTYEGGA